MVPLFHEILRTGQVRTVDGSTALPLDSAITLSYLFLSRFDLDS
jgi:hypothetical protein